MTSSRAPERSLRRAKREVGGELQRYTYDKRGQLLAVLDAQNRPVEQYTYDKAGNILEKFTNGVRTTFTYDKANQLVSSADSKGNSKNMRMTPPDGL